MNESPFYMALDSDPANVSEVQPYIDRVVQQFNIKNDLYGNILVSVTEAVTNAIIHGNQADSNRQVFLDTKIINDRLLAFRITDQGPGFDFEDVPDPTAPSNLHDLNGRGVFLMRQLSDGVVFSDNGSTVELKFKLI